MIHSNQTMRRPLLLGAAAMLLAVPTVARAQCTSTYTSLEARVSEAASVYYGSIVEIERIVIVPPNGTRPGEKATIPDGVVRYVSTVKVAEVLKGEKREAVQLVSETSDFDRRIDEWMRHKSTFLFFVVEPDRAQGKKPLENKWPAPWNSLRLTVPVAPEMTYRSDTPPIFAKDAMVLRKPEEIVARAREFGRRHPKPGKVHTFTIPRSTAELCSPSCDANFLVVPIEPGLEATAKRMISSPREFVAKETDLKHVPRDQLRIAGVDALQYFQSEENENLLKSLLDDPTSVLAAYDFGKYKGKTVRRYEVRERAWEILKSWGKNVPRPITLEVVGESR